MEVNTTAIAILIILFLVMILLRIQIAFAVGIASTVCLLYLGLPLTNVCQQMVKGLNSFSLMAVPFFITMGCLMGAGGISDKIIALADSLVGWMHGGLAMVNIVASYFFGGISGSATADTASIGKLMIPMMVNAGYDADFSTAVTITSSVEGLLVPPSHNMVIYATAAGGVSVGALFMAGYMPGALLAISLMICQSVFRSHFGSTALKKRWKPRSAAVNTPSCSPHDVDGKITSAADAVLVIKMS